MTKSLDGTTDYTKALDAIRPALVAVAAISAAVNVLMLTGPLFMLQVYDRVLASGSVATLQGLFAIVAVLYAFLGFYDFLRHRILSRAGYRLDALLSGPAFALWMRPGTAGPAAAAGSAQPLRDLDILRGFLSGPALCLFDLPWIPLYLGILFLIHPWLGAITLAGAAVVTAAAVLNRHLSEAGLTRAMRMEGAERDFTSQSRRSAETIAAMGMQGRVTARWREMHLNRLGAGQGAGDTGQGFATFSRTFRMFLQSALLSVAAWLTIGGEISGGMIIASSIISGRALAPVDQVIGQWRAILRAREAHRACLTGLAGARPAGAGAHLPDPTGAVLAANLTCLVPAEGEAGKRGRILDHVSFALDPGDGLGVIGPSASGKSTLARLMIGALSPDAGEIRLDGARPAQWDPEDMGRHIGYLPQTVEMLPGTVRDNICRFDPAARDTDVIATAKLAGVHEMILRLPLGYGTLLGAEAAPVLSGGQIQRLALARALYGDPKLIVLDEPNSNLDQEGDRMLAGAIAEMRRRGSTVVVMAHRPGVLAAVNKILVLKDGHAVAFGPKEEVLGSKEAAPAAPPRPAAVVTPIRRETPARGRAALFALFDTLDSGEDSVTHGGEPAPASRQPRGAEPASERPIPGNSVTPPRAIHAGE